MNEIINENRYMGRTVLLNVKILSDNYDIYISKYKRMLKRKIKLILRDSLISSIR